MLIEFSDTGIIVVVVVILLLILVSIQFTLNQILRELREIKKKTDLRDSYRDQNPYKDDLWRD